LNTFQRFQRPPPQQLPVNNNQLESVAELLKLFTNSQPLPFSQVTLSKAEEFRRFMLSAPCGGKKTGTVSHNTAATYTAY
jgi:hypothetical protein